MKEAYPNFDSYAPWVKKLLVLKLFDSGRPQGSWMDHQLLIHRERKGQMVGSLERDEITEMRSKWFEMATPYLENPSVSDKDRAALRKDLEAVKWAAICLDRLIDYDAESTLTTEVAKDSQDNPFVPDAPIEGSPASGENDEARRGETLEPNLEMKFAEVAAQAPPVAEFEVSGEQSQQEPAPPPVAPLARAQDSEARESSTGELVDPAFIQTREQFVEACHTVAHRIAETESLWEAKRLSGMGEILRALASTMQLGKEFELYGKALRLRAYYRAAQLQQNKQTNGEKIFDERLLQDLRKIAEDKFEEVLSQGVEKGNLTDKMFRVSASKSRTAMARNRADDLDPRRFFLSFVCDMRANPSYYSSINAAKLLEDPRILENLDPIEEHYVNFSIAIIGALRAKRVLEKPAET